MSVEQLLGWIAILLTLVGVILAALLVWAFFSPIPFGFRWALEKSRLNRLLHYRRLRRLRGLRHWPSAVFDSTRTRLGAGQAEPSVRVVIDERLTHLRTVMQGAQDAIVEACDNIRHFGSGGRAALDADLDAMQRRSEEVADLGGEIKVDELLRHHQERAKSGINLFFGIFFGIAFALGNGILLNQFSRELIPQYFVGVPVSVIFSVLLVLFEAGVGWLIAINSSPESLDRTRLVRWFFIGVVAVFALVEATIFGLMSYSFELDVPLMDEVPWMRYWLAPLGIVFASTTAGVGYAIHQLFEERAATKGALKLGREVKAANAYVADLPKRWESIRDRAREAKSSLSSYSSALGGRDGTQQEDGALKGLVDRIDRERKALVKALADANPADWKEVADGAVGDDRREMTRGVGLFLVTMAAGAGMVAAMAWTLPRAFGDVVDVPGPIWTAIAVLFVAAVYMLGALPFGRIHNTDVVSGHTYPYRTKPVEYGVAGALGLTAIVVLVWMAVLAFGLRGVVAGLGLAVGAAGITFLGYHFERAWRGGVVAGRVLVALVAAGFVLIGLGVFALAAWLAAAIFWMVWILTKFLGLPCELAWNAYERRRARAIALQPAAGFSPARAEAAE